MPNTDTPDILLLLKEDKTLPNVTAVFVCSTANELLDKINPFQGAFSQGFVFRGQASSEWRLVPSILRTDLLATKRGKILDYLPIRLWIDNRIEENYLHHFIAAGREAGRNFQRDTEGFAPPGFAPVVAAMAQHYGIPTRLIDWTRRSLVAAYFAAVGSMGLQEEGKNGDFSVWATLHTDRVLKSKNFGVSREALAYQFASRFPQYPNEDNENMRAQWGELLDVSFIVQSTGNWENAQVLPNSVDGLIRQMLPTLPDDKIEEIRQKPIFYKFDLPAKEATVLLQLLERDNINGASLFPGLGGIARMAKERMLAGQLKQIEELEFTYPDLVHD